MIVGYLEIVSICSLELELVMAIAVPLCPSLLGLFFFQESTVMCCSPVHGPVSPNTLSMSFRDSEGQAETSFPVETV